MAAARSTDEDDQAVSAGSGEVQVPLEWLWHKFLRVQGWTDRRVLGKQTHCFVWEAWQIYQLEEAYGVNRPMSLF